MKNTQRVSDTDQPVPRSKSVEWLEKIRRKPAERWIIATVLGGIAISWFGTPETGNSQSVFLRLAFPVLIIAMYAWYGYKDVQRVKNYPALRNARVGQLADSVYFLGFLWTLWALIDSFVLHHLSIAEAVFRAFGYALVTTASGMFLRLALLQFSYSAEDQVPLSEQEIEKEIGRFSNAIGNGIISLDSFKNQTDAALSKWIDSINKSTDGLKAAVDNVSTQTASLKDALVEMQKTNAEHVNRLIESALAQFAQKMQPPLEAVNNTVKKMEDAVNTGVKDIKGAVGRGTKQTEEDLSKHTEAINTRLINSTEAVEKATTSLAESLPKQMASLVSNLADVSKQIRNIHVSPDLVEKTIEQQSAAFNKSLMESTMRLQKTIDGLSRSVLNATTQIRYNEGVPLWERLKFWK